MEEIDKNVVPKDRMLARFCNGCGTRLPSTPICSKCGNSNSKGSAFCKKCGFALA
jgi:ribosomal protein L40E